ETPAFGTTVPGTISGLPPSIGTRRMWSSLGFWKYTQRPSGEQIGENAPLPSVSCVGFEPSAFRRQSLAPLLPPWKDHERTMYWSPQRVAASMFAAGSLVRVLLSLPSTFTSISSGPVVNITLFPSA